MFVYVQCIGIGGKRIFQCRQQVLIVAVGFGDDTDQVERQGALLADMDQVRSRFASCAWGS